MTITNRIQINSSPTTDIEAIKLMSPLGSKVTQDSADTEAIIYRVVCGPVKVKIGQFPDMKADLKRRFGGRLLDVVPEPIGYKVRIAKFGIVK